MRAIVAAAIVGLSVPAFALEMPPMQEAAPAQLATKMYTGRNAKPVLDTPYKRSFRTRLRWAASQAPNFAGHYVITHWGCGASCTVYAMVDVRNGRVTFPPLMAMGAQKLAAEAITFAASVNSRLLVVNGVDDQRKPTAYRYVLEGRDFRLQQEETPYSPGLGRGYEGKTVDVDPRTGAVKPRPPTPSSFTKIMPPLPAKVTPAMFRDRPCITARCDRW